MGRPQTAEGVLGVVEVVVVVDDDVSGVVTMELVVAVDSVGTGRIAVVRR
jgi:hypothetical protein